MEPRVDAEERERMVAEAAYFRAERRGFAGGDPVADWVEAEAEVDAALNAQSGALQVQSAALYEHRAEPRGEADGGGDVGEERRGETRGGNASGPQRGAAHRDAAGEPRHGAAQGDEARGKHRSEPQGDKARAHPGDKPRAQPGGTPHGKETGQGPGEHVPHHDELLARIEDGVAEAAKKAEALRKKAGDVGTTARAEVQEQLDRLAELRTALETRRNEIRQQGAQASRSLLEQAESLWNELTAFLSRKAPVSRKRSPRKK